MSPTPSIDSKRTRPMLPRPTVRARRVRMSSRQRRTPAPSIAASSPGESSIRASPRRSWSIVERARGRLRQVDARRWSSEQDLLGRQREPVEQLLRCATGAPQYSRTCGRRAGPDRRRPTPCAARASAVARRSTARTARRPPPARVAELLELLRRASRGCGSSIAPRSPTRARGRQLLAPLGALLDRRQQVDRTRRRPRRRPSTPTGSALSIRASDVDGSHEFLTDDDVSWTKRRRRPPRRRVVVHGAARVVHVARQDHDGLERR